MQQLIDFVEKGKEKLACQLKKSLYGLKQVPKQMVLEVSLVYDFSRLHTQSETHHCMYTRQAKDDILIILILYVDDMLIVGRRMVNISALNSKMAKFFDMKDMVKTSHILGICIQ